MKNPILQTNASDAKPDKYEAVCKKCDHHESMSERHENVSDHHYANERDEDGDKHREASIMHMTTAAMYGKARTAIAKGEHQYGGNYATRGDALAESVHDYEKEHGLKVGGNAKTE